MNQEIFREYDIRGIVGETLDADSALKVGRGFGTYLGNYGGKTVAIGRDNRLSSFDLQQAAIEGLISTGCQVIDVGQLPTPTLYFSVIHLKTDGGMMITASHNPAQYNGFKMRRGEDAVFGEEIQEIRKIIEKGAFEVEEGSRRERNVIDDYLSSIRNRIKLKRRLKVVADAGNGTTGPIVTPLLKALGCELIELYCEPDGNFPHHLPDPTVEKYLVDLITRVKETGADVGVGYDGDGDRLGAVDEKGGIVFGDQLLSLFAQDILQKKKASVVFDVKCSQALIETISNCGGTPVMWKTGYPNIQAKMKETQAPVGGEMSGHFYFMDDYFGFDDGIFASCRLLQLLSGTDELFSQLLGTIPHYQSTPEIRTDCSEKDKFRIVSELKDYFKSKFETIDVDGIRIIFEDGWALIRASNTQPMLVLRFEAKTFERMEEIKKIVRDRLSVYPSVTIDF
ncbi:MAG: phosphomannomutase/phosphoglucomutase [Deltaproteobacteria bacterium]|nr:phosphomannomutase/phosphoglucomutase [Deltaproteobacteria bacterium]